MIIDIVIICPVEVEFGLIRKILKHSISVTTQENNISFDVGQVEGDGFVWNVAVIEPEFDPFLFEIETNEALQTLNPKYVFLAGIAGGIKDPKLGDLVIGTKAYYYEFGKETNQGFSARPKAIDNKSKSLLTLARRISRDIQESQNQKDKPSQIYFGPIASGKKVVAATKKATYELIKQSYNDTQAVEMEACYFALIASRKHIPYLNIRCISDLIDDKSASDAEGHQEKGAKSVAIFLELLISKLPIPVSESPKSLTVNYSQTLSSSGPLRNFKKGNLEFNDGYIKLKTSEGILLIRNITSVDLVKMSGDYSKNWIKVKYNHNNTDSTIYFSSYSIIKIGLLSKGKKQLLDCFNAQKQQQIVFKDQYTF